jgi:hypothetical protein
MLANFPKGWFQSAAEKCFGICMLINLCEFMYTYLGKILKNIVYTKTGQETLLLNKKGLKWKSVVLAGARVSPLPGHVPRHRHCGPGRLQGPQGEAGGQALHAALHQGHQGHHQVDQGGRVFGITDFGGNSIRVTYGVRTRLFIQEFLCVIDITLKR